MAPHIALVTSVPGRPRDDDLAPLTAALANRGATVSAPDWDDPAVDWAGFDLAVIRSTWDYIDRHDEFVAWTRRCASATRLVNDPAVVAWNSDKRYLQQLEGGGVRVVGTTFVSEPMATRSELAGRFPAVGDFVVKPTVSAGSRDTVRYRSGDTAEAIDHVESLVAAGRVAMIQPYQASVDHLGETALFFFGGQFSHAINKGPLLVAGQPPTRALFADEHISPAAVDDELMTLATRSLDVLGQIPELADVAMPLPYVRVDVLRDNDGQLALLELELIEPSIFVDWAHDAPSADGPDTLNPAALRFADVLMSLV